MEALIHADKVLVVDDEPGSLRMITAMLERHQVTVLVATSGDAALDVLKRVSPDLILMDAMMPGLDGFETTALVKRDPELAHIPVVFMTGLSESDHVVRALGVGGVDYVRKPVDLDELLARVRLHMKQGRAARASVASLDATGRLVLATDGKGRLLWCTPLAERAVGRLSSGWNAAMPTLPTPLREAVERLVATRRHTGGSARLECGSRAMELAIIARFRDDEVLIRLNELDPQEDVARLRERLQLTAREAEVLLWLSYGKSNGDISEVLKISPRTVQKHLERIYEKLGVETRSAAAAMALRVTGK